MALLVLGGLSLQGFEVPEQVRFGGAQQLSVHKLIGGGRVVDAMGRDDSAIVWRGVLSGAAAADRARLLDAMRVAGQPVTLTWDSFNYGVVIDTLGLDFCSPYWIPYRIVCVVIQDETLDPTAMLSALAASLSADLAAASPFVDVTQAQVAVAGSQALVSGSTAFDAAVLSLEQAQDSIAQGLGIATGLLDADDLEDVVSGSGTLAQLSCALGFVNRALVNLVNANT